MLIDISKRLTETDLSKPLSDVLSPFEHTFTQETTVEAVIHTLQSKKSTTQPQYFYITDKDNVLVGVLSANELLYTHPKTALSDILETEVIKVRDTDTLEKGLQLLSQHQVLILPVVNQDDRFVGVLEVTSPDHHRIPARKRMHHRWARQDLFQFIGFTIEQGRSPSSWIEYRYRMPWLTCNLVGGLIAAIIGEVFEATLVEFVVLALFIPLVLTLSESVAIQSMTLSLRFMHLRTIPWSQVARRLYTEWKTSLILGVTSAIVITLFYFAIDTQIGPIVAIGGSIVIAMIASATFGALFPILLHQLHLDPKVAAGPLVLMVADVLTIAIYLGFATLLLL